MWVSLAITQSETDSTAGAYANGLSLKAGDHKAIQHGRETREKRHSGKGKGREEPRKEDGKREEKEEDKRGEAKKEHRTRNSTLLCSAYKANFMWLLLFQEGRRMDRGTLHGSV